MISSDQKKLIKKTLLPHYPLFIGIFGSYSRDEQSVSSDLDILIDLKKELNLLDLIGIEQELTDLLGVKVDLVSMRSISERLKPYIQKDLIRIL